jgi:hypothetical protein
LQIIFLLTEEEVYCPIRVSQSALSVDGRSEVKSYVRAREGREVNTVSVR